jgi:hypothetical protein
MNITLTQEGFNIGKLIKSYLVTIKVIRKRIIFLLPLELFIPRRVDQTRRL